MEIVKIVLATLVATSVLRAFSRYASQQFKELFEEPVLLDIILSSVKNNITPERRTLWGLAIQYLTGLVFVVCYHFIWTYADIDPTWFSGLIFGIISGIVAVFSWFFLFKISPNFHKTYFKKYYLQLFVAYILFALTVITIYRFVLLFE